MFNKLLFNKLQYHVHKFNINPWLKFGGLWYSIQYTFLTITSLLHEVRTRGPAVRTHKEAVHELASQPHFRALNCILHINIRSSQITE